MKHLSEYFKKRYRASTLLEMIVTLVVTGIILVALISLFTVILRVSATTYGRANLREDLKDFSLEFEKDLRNARRIGECSGENETFKCDIFINGYYRWQACTVEEPDICSVAGACNDRSARSEGGQRLSMCKIALNPDGSEDSGAEPIAIFDEDYNMNLFRVEVVNEEPINPDDENSESYRKVLLFTTVASSPNKRLNINNIVRQSVISTRNFETLVENPEAVN